MPVASLEITQRYPTGRRFVNRTGDTHGCWTVESFAGFKKAYACWWVICECGRRFVYYGHTLATNAPTHCNCREIKRHPLRPYWHLFRSRRKFDGACVCIRWLQSFDEFLKDVGDRPPGKCLVRLDTSLEWGPGNVAWTVPGGDDVPMFGGIEHNGERLTLHGWGMRLGMSRERVRQLLAKYPKDVALEPDRKKRMRMTAAIGRKTRFKKKSLRRTDEPSELHRLVANAIKNGNTTADVCAAFDVSQSVVVYACKKCRIKRKRGRLPGGKNGKKVQFAF